MDAVWTPYNGGNWLLPWLHCDPATQPRCQQLDTNRVMEVSYDNPLPPLLTVHTTRAPLGLTVCCACESNSTANGAICDVQKLPQIVIYFQNVIRIVWAPFAGSMQSKIMLFFGGGGTARVSVQQKVSQIQQVTQVLLCVATDHLLCPVAATVRKQSGASVSALISVPHIRYDRYSASYSCKVLASFLTEEG